jgi:hypothetical protein
VVTKLTVSEPAVALKVCWPMVGPRGRIGRGDAVKIGLGIRGNNLAAAVHGAELHRESGYRQSYIIDDLKGEQLRQGLAGRACRPVPIRGKMALG